MTCARFYLCDKNTETALSVTLLARFMLVNDVCTPSPGTISQSGALGQC